MANFEEQLTQLETVVERLERGDLTIDESVRLFEEGAVMANSIAVKLQFIAFPPSQASQDCPRRIVSSR